PFSEFGTKPSGSPVGSAGFRPRPLSCTMNALWKSVELSSAFDSVYEAMNCDFSRKRLLTLTVSPRYQVSPNAEYCRMDADVPATPPMSLGRRPAPRAGTTGL